MYVLLRLVSLIVPASHRAQWVEEWSAELEHARATARRSGEVEAHTGVRLVIRTLESVPDALWLRWRHAGLGGFRRTLRDAVRGATRRPGYAAAVVTTLALGMSSTTAIFTVVDSLVLRPVPFEEPEELVSIRGGGGAPATDVEALRYWRSQDRVFSEIRTYGGRSSILTGAGEAREYLGWFVEPGFLNLLGVRPVLGREFTAGDALTESRVMLLGDRVWAEAFGRDPGVVGREVMLDGSPHTVIGVLPRTLRRLPNGVVNYLLPLGDPPPRDELMALARIRSGLTLEAAQARLDELSATLEVERPRQPGWDVRLTPVEQATYRDGAFLTLGAAVLLLFLVACANAAGLLLLRGVTRQPELQLRLALGASRRSLLSQLLTESVLLATAAGVIGIVLAWWGVRGLVAMLPSSVVLFSYTTVSVDGRVLAFSLVMTLLTGVVFGAFPAWRAARSAALAAGRTGTATREEVKLRTSMQIGQMALAVVLLTGAGLFGKSFSRLMSVPIGYDPDSLLELRLVSPQRIQGDSASAASFARDLDERLRALPGVTGVTRSTGVGFMSNYSIELDTGERRDSIQELLPHLSVDTAYFRVMDVQVVEGRSFSAEDVAGGSDAIIVDRDFAAAFWPGGSPVGRRFRIRTDPWVTVVGVTEDVKLEGPDDPLGPYLLFYPASRERLRNGTVLLRTAGAPSDLERGVRATVHELDPDQPVRSVRTGRQVVGETVADPRFLVVIMTALATVAVLLAAVGVYGLVSFVVAQRTRELGIRLALGARAGWVVREIVRWGLTLGATGVVIGLVLSVLLGRFVSGLLFDTASTDPTVLAVTAVATIGACGAALVYPSARAAGIDPAEALRSE